MKNFFKTFLNLFIKPVRTTNEEVENAKLPFGFIHAGVITAVIAICTVISTLISQLFVKKYDFSLRTYTTSFSFDDFEIFELLGSFFGTAILVFGFIMAFAGIMLAIAKILKTNQATFAKTLKIATFALTPYMIAKIAALITAWFAPLSTTFIVIADVYFVFIALFAFAKLLGEENKDKLALCYIILLGACNLIYRGALFVLELIGSNFLDNLF